MENNQIDELPPSFKDLQKLVHLNLRNNRLTRIPQSVHSLAKLQYLFLSSNLIDEVRLIDLYQTKHLKLLDLNENPFPDDHILTTLKVRSIAFKQHSF